MRAKTLSNFLVSELDALSRGPIAVILIEDSIEIASTLQHHLDLGFGAVLALMPDVFDLPQELATQVHRISYDTTAEAATQTAVNAVIKAVPGQWIFYCYNAEYLFYPFCETRSIGEMLEFHAGERRGAMLSFVVDLYADDLDRAPCAVSLAHAQFDRTGYYSLGRKDPSQDYAPKDRQLDFFGGLRWRFEEHVPFERRKIDRVSLIRAKRGLALRADDTLTEEELNTYACPWHHNLTATVCSFRAAKALTSNPGSKAQIADFKWHGSTPFRWHSQQLLDLGLMEPGQWF